MAHILVIDDEKEIRDICADLLECEGHTVEKAADSVEALRMADKSAYDLALVDLVLPGSLNGLGIIERLRNKSNNIRIVAFTGFGSEDAADVSVKAGADVFMAKPFWSKHLVDTVNRLIRKNYTKKVS